MSNRLASIFVGLSIAFLVIGCKPASSSRTEPPIRTAKSLEAPPSASGSQSSAAGDSDGTTERNFDGAVFRVPAAWEDVPPRSTFLTAEFRVKGPDGPGRLTLSTAGGAVADNIERWKGQFLISANDPSPKESQLDVDGRKATLVELFGDFRDMGDAGVQTKYAMLGAVIPLQQTNYFVKLTGPKATVAAARDAFVKFVESAKFRE